MATTAFRILVALDFSPSSLCSLDHALAWALRARCELHLLHVVEHAASGELAYDFAELGRLAEARLRALGSDPRVAERVAHVERHVIEGAPQVEIVAAAERLGVDLLVMGRDGGADEVSRLRGPVADAVRRRAAGPVLFVGAADAPPPAPVVRRVVCPVDIAPCSRCAGFTAARLARLHDAELLMLHVLPETAAGTPDFDRLLGELRRDVEIAVGLEVRTAVARDAAAIDLVQRLRAGDGELLVLGDGGAGLAGSLADVLVREVRCPIVVVPRPDALAAAASDVRFDTRSALLVVDVDAAGELVKPINTLVRRAVAQGALVIYCSGRGELAPGLRVCGPVLRGETPARLTRFVRARAVERLVIAGAPLEGEVREVALEALRQGLRTELLSRATRPGDAAVGRRVLVELLDHGVQIV